jgi:hypothetical protein
MGEDISEDCFEGLRVKIITLENMFVLKFVIKRKSIVEHFCCLCFRLASIVRIGFAPSSLMSFFPKMALLYLINENFPGLITPT